MPKKYYKRVMLNFVFFSTVILVIDYLAVFDFVTLKKGLTPSLGTSGPKGIKLFVYKVDKTSSLI